MRLSSLLVELLCGQDPLLIPFEEHLREPDLQKGLIVAEFLCGQEVLLIPFEEHLREPGLHKGLNHLLNLTAGPARHKGRTTRNATKTAVLISFRQGLSTICASFLTLPSLLKVLQDHSHVVKFWNMFGVPHISADPMQ